MRFYIKWKDNKYKWSKTAYNIIISGPTVARPRLKRYGKDSWPININPWLAKINDGHYFCPHILPLKIRDFGMQKNRIT